jgi:hypothetical protein
MAATYTTKYLLKSNIYSGRFATFDTEAECKAEFESRMVDAAYMEFDTTDLDYYIIPVLWASWS